MYRIKIDLVIALIPFILVWMSLPKECDSAPPHSSSIIGKGDISSSESSLGSMNVHQLNSLVRDALSYLEKANQKRQQRQERIEPKIRYFVEPHYSGMVKLRAIRSDFGDMANVLRLYQLQELENKYGTKARPRFGKRTEVTQDNFLPPYGYSREDDEYEEAGDAKVSQSSPFQPEDDEEDEVRRDGR